MSAVEFANTPFFLEVVAEVKLDPKVQSELYQSHLVKAVSHGSLRFAKWLLENKNMKLRIDIVDAHKSSILHIVARSHSPNRLGMTGPLLCHEADCEV